MGICERNKELKRRRKRRVQLKKFRAKLANTSDHKEKQRILAKIRRMSPNTATELAASK